MRTKTGIITSTKMDKTVVVQVDTYKIHPKYKKRYKVSKKFLAHDETEALTVGQEITIQETKPMSKRKCWIVV